MLPKGLEREWKTWDAMKSRCGNPRNASYRSYGERGVTVCERWLRSFKAFLEDVGRKPDGMTLDRIDSNGNYEPGNVRWATPKQQSRNKRNNFLVAWHGSLVSAVEVGEQTGLPGQLIRDRLRSGWTIEEAISIPAAKRSRQPNNSKRGMA